MRPITLMLLMIFALSPQAANLSREQRLSEQLDHPAQPVKAIWLQAGPQRSLALLEENRAGRRLGGVILLHDSGAHADWQAVIAPLRRHLADIGWDSISLQMPIGAGNPASAGKLPDDASPRIRAAVDYLRGRQPDLLVLIGHGEGALRALAYLGSQPQATVRGLVAIGLPAPPDGAGDAVIAAIGGLGLPLLDLFGSRDLPEVVESSQARRGAARRNRREGYRQERVMGADHDFSGLEQSLEQRVGAWLRRLAGANYPG